MHNNGKNPKIISASGRRVAYTYIAPPCSNQKLPLTVGSCILSIVFWSNPTDHPQRHLDRVGRFSTMMATDAVVTND